MKTFYVRPRKNGTERRRKKSKFPMKRSWRMCTSGSSKWSDQLKELLALYMTDTVHQAERRSYPELKRNATRYLVQKIREKQFSSLDRLTDKPHPVVPTVDDTGKGKGKNKGDRSDFIQQNEDKETGKGKDVRHHLLVENSSLQMANEQARAV